MLRNVWHLLYGATPAEFESRYSIEQSVRRLAEGADVWSLSLKERMVGKVSESRVRLWRRPALFWSNDYRPEFKGQFRSVGGRTVLVGGFGASIYSRVVNTLFIGIGCLFCFVVAVTALEDGFAAGMAVVLLFPLVAVLFAMLFRWLARHDVPWLEAQIRGRLQD